TSGETLLLIDILGESVEFCVIGGSDGTIQFSRAAEVPHPQDRLAIADAVITETRRTWMSALAAGLWPAAAVSDSASELAPIEEPGAAEDATVASSHPHPV